MDGRSWTLRPGVDLSEAGVLGNGQRAVVVGHPSSQGVVEAFEDDLRLTTLAQTGDVPTEYWHAALGPTGLVVVDGTKHRFVVGVPTGG
jgi:hypothetical protein